MIDIKHCEENYSDIKIISALYDDGYVFENDRLANLRLKVESNGVRLGDLEGIVVRSGLATGCDKAFILDYKGHEDIIEKYIGKFIFKCISCKNLDRDIITYDDRYIIHIDKGFTNRYGLEKFKGDFKDLISLIEYMDMYGKAPLYGNGFGLKDRTTQGDYWWESNIIKDSYLEKALAIKEIVSEERMGLTLKEEDVIALCSNITIQGCKIDLEKIKYCFNDEIVKRLNCLLYFALKAKKQYGLRVSHLKDCRLPKELLEGKGGNVYGFTDDDIDYLRKLRIF